MFYYINNLFFLFLSLFTCFFSILHFILPSYFFVFIIFIFYSLPPPPLYSSSTSSFMCPSTSSSSPIQKPTKCRLRSVYSSTSLVMTSSLPPPLSFPPSLPPPLCACLPTLYPAYASFPPCLLQDFFFISNTFFFAPHCL